ncbi:MAG TPA: hypothetical protein VK824_00395 [Planctomycetota bacterium]|nr:hypothetical protein [Planctomycetota bacterium]
MSDQQHDLGIMSSGRENLRRASRDRARAELKARHREKVRAVGLIRGLIIAWRIRREVRRIAEDEAPRDALYIRRAGR